MKSFLLSKLLHRKLAMNKNNTIITSTSDPGAISQATELLKRGFVIALPTDTIYGFACVANNQNAIKKLYSIKGRHEEKPVAICVADYADIAFWAEVPEQLDSVILKELLPGPVTLVLQKSKNLSHFVNPDVQKIGIRIPDFNFIRKICRELNEPIALTSANKSAEQSTLNISEFQSLWSELGGVFDGGCLSQTKDQRAGSTVIDLSNMPSCTVIRKGNAYHKTKSILEKFNIVVE